MSALPALAERVPAVQEARSLDGRVMRDALTAEEYAELSVAMRWDYPTTKSGMIRHAKAEKWPFRQRQRPHGATGRPPVEYPILGLPEPLREALLNAVTRRVPAVCALLGVVDHVSPSGATVAPTLSARAVAAIETAPTPGGLADWQVRAMESRAALLAEIDRQSELCGLSWTKAAAAMVQAARTGALAEVTARLVAQANARGGKTGSRTLSLRSLERWEADHRKGGVKALAPAESRTPATMPEWLPLLLDLYRRPQKPSLPACLEELAKLLPPGVKVPPLSTARAWLNKVAPQTRNKGRMGPRAMLAMRAYKHRDTSALSPMDIVVADGHTFRAKVAHPIHGRPFQPEVMVVIDVVTRLAVGWSAGLAESTQVTMDGLRNAVENLGLPVILHTDNGSGFCNEAASDELLGFYARLGVTHLRSEPGRAQARGLIERRQATLWRRSARKLPTYVGRDMDREAGMRVAKLVEKDIKDKGASRLLMSWAEFLEWAQGEIDAYNARPQRCLPRIRAPETGASHHMSPAQALAAWREKGWEPESLAPDEIDDLFRPQESRVTTRGEVRLPWGTYFHAALEQFHGDKVRVGYDIHDGSKVWVRTFEDGRLICVATRDGNAVPYAPNTMVEHSRAKRVDRRVKVKMGAIAEIRLEGGVPRQIDGAATVDLTPEQRERANAEYLRLVAPVEPIPAPAPTPDARPTFADDAAWAEWLIAHPDKVDDRDRSLIRDVLRNGATRSLLKLRGIDADKLSALARAPTHQDGKTTCALAT